MPHSQEIPKNSPTRRERARRDLARSVFTFAAVCAVSVVLAWLGGFAFDSRNPIVAMYVGATLAVATLLAFD